MSTPIAEVTEQDAASDFVAVERSRDQRLTDAYREAHRLLDTFEQLGVPNRVLCKARLGLNEGYTEAIRRTDSQD